jgi:hypothetical protein
LLALKSVIWLTVLVTYRIGLRGQLKLETYLFLARRGPYRGLEEEEEEQALRLLA